MARVMDMIQSRGEMVGESKLVLGGDGDTIVLDTTAEFCRQVGEGEEKEKEEKEDGEEGGSDRRREREGGREGEGWWVRSMW